jgi:hypothetical protein
MKKFLIFLALLQSFSCTQLTPEEKMLKETLGKTIHTEMFTTVQEGDKFLPFDEFRNRYSFVSVVYLEDGCRPCYPKYIEWQSRMDSLQLNDNFTVLFIIQGISYDRFMRNLLEAHPEYNPAKDRFHIIMAPDHQFISMNMEVPRQFIDRSVLIDKDNKIRLVGYPFATPQMTTLFNRICNEKEN